MKSPLAARSPGPSSRPRAPGSDAGSVRDGRSLRGLEVDGAPRLQVPVDGVVGDTDPPQFDRPRPELQGLAALIDHRSCDFQARDLVRILREPSQTGRVLSFLGGDL